MGRDGNGVTPRESSIQLTFTWNGKRRRETLKMDGVVLPPTAANLKVAHRTMRDLRAALDTGTFDYAAFFPASKHATNSGSLTFGKACDEFLEAKGRLAKNTRDQYRNALTMWRAMFGEDTPLAGMRHASMAAKIGRQPWASAKLLNNYMIPLRGVFALHKRDLRIADPTDGIENARHQKPPPDPLSDEERDQALADMARHYDGRVVAYFGFMFYTGMRPEEAIALRWSDVDWNLATARVQRARSRSVIGPVKTYAVRDVDLTGPALGYLKAMKAHTFMAGEDKEVFQNPVTGEPWNDPRSQNDNYWKPALRRCGIRARRAYCTRHTYATSAIMGGVKPGYIARQMGHKNTKMLFEVYSRWIDLADGGRERRQLEQAHAGTFKKEAPNGTAT